MRLKPLTKINTEARLNYWPYYSLPVYSHASSYDKYKLGSMYSWFLRSAAHHHSPCRRAGYYYYSPYTGQHDHSYFPYYPTTHALSKL